MSEIAICRKCGQSVEIRWGEEHTGFCDNCAQEMIADFVETLETIRDHDGWAENNREMKPSEWREHLRDLAFLALDRFGLNEPETEDDDEKS